MSTQTVPKSGKFKTKCQHCDKPIGDSGFVKTKLYEMKLHECVACHELTLVRDCVGYVILNKVS